MNGKFFSRKGVTRFFRQEQIERFNLLHKESPKPWPQKDGWVELPEEVQQTMYAERQRGTVKMEVVRATGEQVNAPAPPPPAAVDEMKDEDPETNGGEIETKAEESETTASNDIEETEDMQDEKFHSPAEATPGSDEQAATNAEEAANVTLTSSDFTANKDDIRQIQELLANESAETIQQFFANDNRATMIRLRDELLSRFNGGQ